MANFVAKLMGSMFLIDEENRGYVVFVRHGESVRQSEPGDDHDSFDTPLSERGRSQANAVAERLSGRSIDSLYSSPLKRAHETAEIVAEETGLDVSVDEDLREVDIDHSRAMKAMEDESFLENLDNKIPSMEDFRWGALDFAESSESLRQRVESTVDSIVENHPGETLVIFSHTGVINTYLTSCIGLDSDFLTLPAHTSLSTIRTLDDRRVVVTVNDYSHLR